VLQHRLDVGGVRACPFRGDAWGPATDTGIGRLQVTVNMADALPAGIFGLPHFPAVAALGVPYDKPVVRRE